MELNSYTAGLLTPDSEANGRWLGLKWKILGVLVVGSLFIAILGLVLVNHQMSQLIRRQSDRRALDIATNLGDGAAPHLMRGKGLELHALVTKYSLLSGIAYAAIRDRQGKIVAHSLGPIPADLEGPLRLNQRETSRREVNFQGRLVFETHNPILSGQAGSVDVGVWADTLDNEIRQVLFSLAGVLGSLVAGIAALSFFVVRKFVHPVIRLRDIVDRVSMGELERTVAIESNDEIGDLAVSVDRLRSSLRAAMVRLEHA
jgi:HAMP domain-containing protein